MRILFLLLLAIPAWGQFGAATQVVNGNGAPNVAYCTSANNVGMVYARKDGAGANTTFYVCSNTAVSTYAWELLGSGGGGGDVSGGSTLTSAGPIPFVTALGTIGPSGASYSTSNISGGNAIKLVTGDSQSLLYSYDSGGGVLESGFIASDTAEAVGKFFSIYGSGFRYGGFDFTPIFSVKDDGTMTLYNETAVTGVSKSVVRAGAGQSTTNLHEWQDASGATMAAITSGGGLNLTGSVAGNVEYGQGTAPSVGTNSIKMYAGTSVTAYKMRFPSAAATGVLYGTNTAGDVVQSFVDRLPAAAVPTRSYGVAVGDPAGSALATGVLGYVVAPAACTISGWDVVVDSGTATVDVWKVSTGTAKPTVANTITASAKPAISTGTAIASTTLTGWTTSVAAGDIFGFNLDATSGPKYITVDVRCQ